MPKFLYSASLETHMDDYMKNVKLTQLNNDYQIAQDSIVREGEAMQASQAEIMNKIAQMQETLKGNIAGKLIPRSQTDSPEPKKAPKEEYKPMTASEYENALQKRGTKGIPSTSKEITELTNMGREDLLPIIKELKDYRAQRKQFEEDIINAKNNISQLKLKANLKKLEKKEEKKMEMINNKIMKNEDLLNSIQNRLANLRPAERNTYKEPISKFQKELKEAIKLREAFNIYEEEKKPASRLILRPPSSQATTTTSTMASKMSDIKQKPGSWAQEKSAFTRSEKFKTLPPAIRAEVSMKTLTKKRFNAIISEFGGSGLKKKRGKK